MNNQVKQGITRLQKILPLEMNLKALDGNTIKLYRLVIEGFFENGKPPLTDHIKQQFPNAGSVLKTLSDIDMLTLDQSGEIRGCYPFTTDQRVHRVDLNGHQVHAMCALDALAPSAMFDCQSRVQSECVVTGNPVDISLDRMQLLNPEQADKIYFGIDWMAANAVGSCSDSLCTEMHFLKDQTTADAWVNQPQGEREIYTLSQAIEFSAGFFKPLMD